MLGRSVVVFCALLLGPAWSAFGGLDPDLAAWWAFDEGQGTVARDGSGHGNDGTLTNGPTWVPGRLETALQFNGTNTSVRAAHIPLDSRSFTITMWINPVLTGSAIVFSQSQSSSTNLDMHFRIGGPSSTDAPVRAVRMGFYSNDLDTPTNVIQDNTWYHLAFWYDFEAQNRKIYVNGVQAAQASAAPFLGASGNTVIGSWASSQYFNGIIDDVQIYHRALSDGEVARVMTGLMDASLASSPDPAKGATDVHQDAVLSWKPSPTAATHDVYMGTSFEDVNEAGRADAKGVLASQGQTAATYDPDGLLEYGQTYYWRIDEVNGAPDNTISRGEVWSFTAEPYAYPIQNVIATASSTQGAMSPQKTADGSGLNANNEHSTLLTDMWVSIGVQPNWIQYEFDKVYKLHELLVWNSNQIIESFVGFGVKTAKIEYSTDGATWTALEGIPEFGQGTGLADYTPNTTVSFGGVSAKFVKLTVESTWSGGNLCSLSEVRFLSVPVQAREPQPATGATGVAVDTDLDWRPGRDATSHQVFIGADSNSVRDGLVPSETVAGHGHTPASLTFATKYFWKVDAVGDAGTYAGDVWDFTTAEYAAIDDFEGYTDDEGSRIYESWIDGITNGASGSTVGYMQAPFAERSIVHGGVQSMPLTYDNTVSPFYSEAERTFASPQDWTANGADTVSVSFKGISPGFVQIASGSILMNGIGSDIWGNADQFRFAYKTLEGNGTMTARVNSIDNSDVWAKAGVMIRENTNGGSVHGSTVITPSGGNGASFQRRPVVDAASANNDSATVIRAPYWVKIERAGDNFTSFVSPDGVTWTQLGAAVAIPMSSKVLVGLAVCSHSAAVMTGAEFSDIKTTGNVTGDWQFAEIGIGQQEGNSVESLYLTVQDSAGKTVTLVNPDTAATGRMTWQQWKIPLSDLTSAGLKTTGITSIKIGVGNRTSPAAGGAGKLYIDDIGYGHPLP